MKKRSIRRSYKAGRKTTSCFRKHLQRCKAQKEAKENRRKNKVWRDRYRQMLRSKLVQAIIRFFQILAGWFNSPQPTEPAAAAVEAKAA